MSSTERNIFSSVDDIKSPGFSISKIFHENHMTVTECNEIIHQEEPERLAAI